MSRHFLLTRIFLIAFSLILSRAVFAVGPVVTATKDDNLAAGLRKVVGDKITYTITVGNSGATATSVLLTDPDPANTTFFSVNSTPIARNDTYSAIGNVQITIPAGSGLLANDNDPDDAVNGAGTLTVSAAPSTTTQGGNLGVNADGSFTYNPAPGFTGADSFTYTLLDSEGSTDTATVTINVANTIWFIDNSVGSSGDGRLGTPFKTIANYSASSPSKDAGDIIYFYTGSGSYSGTLTLVGGQKVIGQGVALAAAAGLTPPTGSASLPGSGTKPTLANAGTILTLATSGSANEVRGLSLRPSSGFGILGSSSVGATVDTVDISPTSNGGGVSLTSLSGAFTATSCPISVIGTSPAVLVSGAAGQNVSFDSNSPISDTGASRVIDVQSHNGGTIAFNGAVSGTTSSTGLYLDSNTGTTINFAGTITISTTTSPAFTATGGGTITLTGSASTLNSASATALNVANTTIGSTGLTFISISAGNNTAAADPANGIILNNTGGNGGLTVTGSGATDGSGGTIQNTTTRGASFISASKITLKNMNFNNAATADFPAAPTGLSLGANTGDNCAIHLETAFDVTLDNLNISGSAEQGINGHNVTNFSLKNSVLSNLGQGADEDGIHFFNMLGTCEILNTTISSSGDDNVNIQNNTNLSL
nr:Ig-like domain-containing protein [Verrucomicrobiae bacterium]